MKSWIAVIAAAALGIATWVLFHHASGGPEAASAGAPVTRPAAEPTRPAIEGRRALRLTSLPPAVRTDRAPAEDAGGAAPAPAPAGPAPTSEEMRDRLDAFFSAEAVDPAWNQQAAATLTRGIQAALPAGSGLRRLECRGTLCRIETSHLDADAFRAYAKDAFLERETRVGSSGFFANLLGDPAAGGPVVAVAYVVREGKHMPGPDELFPSR
jgi:hypothetical protein